MEGLVNSEQLQKDKAKFKDYLENEYLSSKNYKSN